MGNEEPEWNSGDPQSWSTYFSARYKIEGSPEVVVRDYVTTKAQAKKLAREAMDEALADLVKHKVKVNAESYIIKTRTRTQTQTFEPEVERNDQVTTGVWYGSFTSIHRGLAKTGELDD